MIRTFAMGALVCLAAQVGVRHSTVGNRQGILGGASELRIMLHVGPGSDGALAGWPDSEDWGAVGIPVTAMSLRQRISPCSLTPSTSHAQAA
jgi:hypothetical protein